MITLKYGISLRFILNVEEDIRANPNHDGQGATVKINIIVIEMVVSKRSKLFMCMYIHAADAKFLLFSLLRYIFLTIIFVYHCYYAITPA